MTARKVGSVNSGETEPLLGVSAPQRKDFISMRHFCASYGLRASALLAALAFVVVITWYGFRTRHTGEKPPLIPDDPLAPLTQPFPTTTHSLKPSPGLWSEQLHRPFPTGAWWLNLVLDDGTTPVAPLPYAIKALLSGLQICYSQHVQSVTRADVIDGFSPDLSISQAQGAFKRRRVVAYDDLAVTVQFGGMDASGSSMIAHLARGSPFMTVECDSIALVLQTAGAILGVSVASLSQSDGNCTPELSPYPQPPNQQPIQTQTLLLSLNSGQYWLVHASTPFSLAEVGPSSLRFDAAFTGVLRVAVLPPGADPGDGSGGGGAGPRTALCA